MEKYEGKEKVQTMRLDLKTRIYLGACKIFSMIEGITVDEAINKAVEIENAADAKVKEMKERNPVFPQARRRFEKEKLPTQ